MKIILVRHGQTIANQQGIVQGYGQGELTILGRKQAEHLAEKLKNEPIDYIYCSDLDRAVQTAKPIISYHPKAKVSYTQVLRERNLGNIEGEKIRKLNWKFIKFILTLGSVKNGESWGALLNRAREFHNQIIQKHTNKDMLLIVSHDAYNKALISVILKKNFWLTYLEYPQQNAGIYRFEI